MLEDFFESSMLHALVFFTSRISLLNSIFVFFFYFLVVFGPSSLEMIVSFSEQKSNNEYNVGSIVPAAFEFKASSLLSQHGLGTNLGLIHNMHYPPKCNFVACSFQSPNFFIAACCWHIRWA